LAGEGWLLTRARQKPGVLVHAAPSVRAVFEHGWAPMQALARQVACLPLSLTDYLLRCESGFVVVDDGDSRYEPGCVAVRRQVLLNVAFVSVWDLARLNDRPLHVLGHLIDHHLGSGGSPEGPWLSELPDPTCPASRIDQESTGSDRPGPYGRTAVRPMPTRPVAYSGLAEAGARLRHLFELGYGVDDSARSNCRDYFAQSLAWYCRNRARLNVADPQVCKWFRNTLWSEAFWRRLESGRD